MHNYRRLLLPGAIFLTVILWASAFVGIRAAIVAYSPAHLALLRFSVASLILLTYAFAKRVSLPRTRDMPAIALCGLIGIALYNIALNAGEQTITAGAASFLVNTVPLWTVLLSVAFLKEQSPWQSWVGISISFMGAAVISLGEGSQMQISLGAGLVLLAAVAQASYFVMSKPFLQRYKPVEFTIYAIVSGTIFLLPFFPGLIETVRTAPLKTTIAVVYLGVGPAAIAYFTWSYVLSQMPASKATSFLYFVPVVAIGIAWIWLEEVPSLTSLIGGVLAISGVFLVNSQRRKQ